MHQHMQLLHAAQCSLVLSLSSLPVCALGLLALGQFKQRAAKTRVHIRLLTFLNALSFHIIQQHARLTIDDTATER